MESIQKFFKTIKEDLAGLYFLNVELKGLTVMYNKDPCWKCYHRGDNKTETCVWIHVHPGSCGKGCKGHSSNICMDCGHGSLGQCGGG